MAISRRRHSSIASGSCALVLALVGLAGAPTAYASEDPQGGVPGNYTGADVSDPQDDRELTQQAKEKIALTEAWYAAQQGISSQSSYTEQEEKFLKKYGLTKLSGENRSALPAPASRLLPLTHYGQSTSYYCGPATGAMMIKMVDGSIKSRYNGNAFGQGSLANSPT